MNAHPILTSTGSFLAPPQSSHVDRASGPWAENRGRDVRLALAGEIPVRVVEANRQVLIERARLLELENDRREAALVSIEVLAELANGRRV